MFLMWLTLLSTAPAHSTELMLYYGPQAWAEAAGVEASACGMHHAVTGPAPASLQQGRQPASVLTVDRVDVNPITLACWNAALAKHHIPSAS
jgi:hypothetical protein